MDLTISKTERHASASLQLLIVMRERKAAPVEFKAISTRLLEPGRQGELGPAADLGLVAGDLAGGVEHRVGAQ